MVSCDEMRRLEKMADERGLSYRHMMENAGRGAAEKILEEIDIQGFPVGKSVVVLCGKGGNGGDGFVVARLLNQSGFKVSVILVEGKPDSECTSFNYDLCLDMDIEMLDMTTMAELEKADIIIDGIYGTGFRGSLKREVEELIGVINGRDAYVVALDLPSGLSGDNGNGLVGIHVKSDLTVTFHDEKPIHSNGGAFLGKVSIVDIGI